MMRYSRVVRLIVTVVLVLSASFTYGQPPAALAAGPEENLPPIKLPIKEGNPKLDSQLNQFVAAQTARATPGQPLPNNAQSTPQSVRVIIETSANQTSQIKQAAANLGAVESSYGNLIQMTIPVGQLPSVAQVPGVRFVRTPLQPVEDVLSEGVNLIGANTWQAASFNGSGVKIGIIDGGFSGYTTRQTEGELPASITYWPSAP